MADEEKKRQPPVRGGNVRKAAARGARAPGRRGANNPAVGAGANAPAAAAATPNVAGSLRSDATQTIKDDEARWSQFRTDGGDVLNTYFNQTFGYLQGILGSSSSPTDWVKDGLALLIGYYGAGRKLYAAAHKLYPYQG
jgi:hypothetical protein